MNKTRIDLPNGDFTFKGRDMKKSDTKTIISAMRVLSVDIQSEDGIANMAISEAADRLEELADRNDLLVKTFKRGDLVRKKSTKGQWHGYICGEYSTDITPEGYAVESIYEQGSVQIYPESALELYIPPSASDYKAGK